MSGQTVTGLGLQFTDDNKFCYALSGVIPTAGSQSSAGTQTLLFTTLSYYAIIKVIFSNDLTSVSANEYYAIKFNDVVVYQAENEHNLDTVTNPSIIHIIIPPFTKVETLAGSSGDSMETTTIISGEVGMSQRVGN